MRVFLIAFLLINNLYAQKNNDFKLKVESDGNWIEYAMPEFMKNISQADNMSPHFFQYDFESADKKVKIYILVNNSMKFKFDLTKAYLGILKRKDIRITYKNHKEDKYFISGILNNGRTLYQFCKVKNSYGYTYSIEYDKLYSDYFNQKIPEIIRDFKILF